jgi:hypothetical protein
MANDFTYFKPTTDGISMFSNDVMLRISYYDASMRIEMRHKNTEGKYPSPEIGKDISILLNADNVAKLNIMLDEFDKKLISYNNDFADGKDCSEYKPYSIAVFTGLTPDKTKILQISTGTVTDKGFIPEIMLHIGVDEKRVALTTHTFKTTVTPLLVNYDKDTGDVDMQVKMSQYEIFNAAIRNFMSSATKACSHFSKTVINDERLSKMESLVKLIADHFNIALPENEYSRNYNNFNNAAFGSFNSNNVQPPVIENGGDIGTLLGGANY